MTIEDQIHYMKKEVAGAYDNFGVESRLYKTRKAILGTLEIAKTTKDRNVSIIRTGRKTTSDT